MSKGICFMCGSEDIDFITRNLKKSEKIVTTGICKRCGCQAGDYKFKTAHATMEMDKMKDDIIKWLNNELYVVYGNEMFESTGVKLKEHLDKLQEAVALSAPEPRTDISNEVGYFSSLLDWKNKNRRQSK